MEDPTQVMMVERICVNKFDHTHEDKPTEPVETIVQETRTPISLDAAMLMGFVPKSQQPPPDDPFQVEATGTVQIGGSDSCGPTVGD